MHPSALTEEKRRFRSHGITWSGQAKSKTPNSAAMCCSVPWRQWCARGVRSRLLVLNRAITHYTRALEARTLNAA
jgi:hypothetical protein